MTPREINPPKVAEGSPNYPSGDYSYVLEIVMNMQVTMGKLTEAVESLKAESKASRDKLERIGNDVHAAKVVVAYVGGLIVLAAGFLGWIGSLLVQYLSARPLK